MPDAPSGLRMAEVSTDVSSTDRTSDHITGNIMLAGEREIRRNSVQFPDFDCKYLSKGISNE
jgi:hypothetical protein